MVIILHLKRGKYGMLILSFLGRKDYGLSNQMIQVSVDLSTRYCLLSVGKEENIISR